MAAAVTYAAAPQRWLYLTDGQIIEAVNRIATPRAASRLANDVLAEVGAARQQLGTATGRVWWLVRPLAWKVEVLTSDEARVSVWVVTVLSAEGVAVPQSEWVTVTIDLAWIDTSWRVDAVRDTAGPTPQTGPKDQPWETGLFDKALAGFTRIDGKELS